MSPRGKSSSLCRRSQNRVCSKWGAAMIILWRRRRIERTTQPESRPSPMRHGWIKHYVIRKIPTYVAISFGHMGSYWSISKKVVSEDDSRRFLLCPRFTGYRQQQPSKHQRTSDAAPPPEPEFSAAGPASSEPQPAPAPPERDDKEQGRRGHGTQEDTVARDIVAIRLQESKARGEYNTPNLKLSEDSYTGMTMIGHPDPSE